jgi:AcrR family transcriptional regulator
MKPEAVLVESKPYHHGDLRRALLRAAIDVLEREGSSALSLRAVAREAGVSPAAPYHHFKDKSELLGAVAAEGFERLRVAIAAALDAARGQDVRSAMGLAYVEFARANPALYRVMWESARNSEGVPNDGRDIGDPFEFVRDSLREATQGRLSELDIQLTAIASWCAAHGLAEISTFIQFAPLKEAMGGEQAFLKAVLDHMGFVTRHDG